MMRWHPCTKSIFSLTWRQNTWAILITNRIRRIQGESGHGVMLPPLWNITSQSYTFQKSCFQRRQINTNPWLVSCGGWLSWDGLAWSLKSCSFLPSLRSQGQDTLRQSSTFLHIWTINITPGWCLIQHTLKLTWTTSGNATVNNFMARQRNIWHLTHL